jgi:hypothetical protein
MAAEFMKRLGDDAADVGARDAAAALPVVVLAPRRPRCRQVSQQAALTFAYSSIR